MTLFEQINADYIAAYKAKETVRVSVLRMLKTSVKNRLVELRRPGGELSDEEMLDIVLKEGKQRRDSIAEYEKAGRSDLASREAEELAILEAYLPAAMSEEELAAAVEQAVAEAGASSPREMGKVMSLLMPRCKGHVDGRKLSQAVRDRLSR
ncbi:MAG: GatB/YqeY domain-containing protein [Desulfovibrio sp.]|nr:GatB/YqeY domain-containing protein [Desulfovibrio sp.]